jgi:cobalamin biosynthetic protein CobC
MLDHGGRLNRAVREYGLPREAWLDLSTGVSPHGWPTPAIPPVAWHRLPEDDDGLLDAARAYYGCEDLLPVAGSQAAIAALPRLRLPSRVAVVAPGYAEHAHAWRQAGHEVVAMRPAEMLANAAGFDVAILIRPNNPTGECLDDEFLLSLQEALGGAMRAESRRQRPWLIVDEAFIDACHDRSLIRHPREGLIVLRSIGKFFGLAGARAGFVAAWPALLDALAEALGPWTLSGPTRHVVARALADREWQASARAWLRASSSRLAALLARHRMAPTGGCEFFQYVERPDARMLHRALAERAILVRHFEHPLALRFGLPADDASFARLDRALAEVAA